MIAQALFFGVAFWQMGERRCAAFGSSVRFREVARLAGQATIACMAVCKLLAYEDHTALGWPILCPSIVFLPPLATDHELTLHGLCR